MLGLQRMDYPAPTRTTLAALAANGSPRRHGRSADFDALADLFLGEAEPTPVAGPAGGASTRAAGAMANRDEVVAPVVVAAEARAHRTQLVPRIEAVLLGHLPVAAAAWATQYARTRASELGQPVALARLSGQWLSIRVITPRHVRPDGGEDSKGMTLDAQHADAAASFAMPAAASAGSCAMRAAGALAGRVGAILLCTVTGDEHRLIGQNHLHDVTLVTGADEASTVAAYRVIKSMASSPVSGQANAAFAYGSASGKRAWRPNFRLMIAGAEASQAGSVWRRLAEASRTFLAVELELAGTMPRIVGGGTAVDVFDGPLTVPLYAVLAAACGGESAGEAELARFGATRDGMISAEVGQHGDAQGDGRSSGLHLVHAPTFAGVGAGEVDFVALMPRAIPKANAAAKAVAKGADKISPSATISPVPPLTVEVPRRSGAASTPTPIAQCDAAIGTCLSTLRLRPLPIGCPICAKLVLASDALGTLHILSLAAPTVAGHETSIVALLRARQWARDQAELLSALVPSFDGHDAEVHLLSYSGSLARHACVAGISVHVAAKVMQAASVTLACLTDEGDEAEAGGVTGEAADDRDFDER